MSAHSFNVLRSGARIFVFAAVGLLAWLQPALAQTDLSQPGAAEWHVVQTFDGRTAGPTATFTVGANWEVAWAAPTPVEISILSSDGTLVAGTTGLLHGALFQPKGGTFYLQVDGGLRGAMAPWHLVILQPGPPPAGATAFAATPDTVFTPPMVLPPSVAPVAVASGATTANPFSPGGAPASPAPGVSPGAAPAVPAAPVVNLTADQSAAVVMIEGDKAEGTGFLVRMADGPVVVTNLHVLAGNPNLRILTNTGAQIYPTGLKGATDRDLAIMPIQDAHYSYLQLNTAVGGSVQTGDDVITPGNSQGGEVTLATHGTILAVGPQRVEINNPIYHGNSGGPVVQTKTGKVIGVVTEAVKVDTTNELDKTSFASRNSAITGAMRYFGLRLDTVPQWETFDPARFLSETNFLEDFHQQSRRLDSYLNSSDKTDTQNSSNDENAQPDSRLYLSDKKICGANDDFFQQAGGGSAAERLDAFRQWIFALNTVADTGMTTISNTNNFYTYDRQRSQDELGYRNALKQELQSYGDDVNRVGSLHRSN